MRVYMFDILWSHIQHAHEGYDLRDVPKLARFQILEKLSGTIGRHIDCVQLLPFYAHTQAKKDLCKNLFEGGYEGEVWTDVTSLYTPGKHGNHILRTKYLKEVTVGILGFTETTAEGFLFGAIHVEYNGIDAGHIGTGFTREQQQLIWDRFHAGVHTLPVVCQGFTVDGKLWHARLSEDYE